MLSYLAVSTLAAALAISPPARQTHDLAPFTQRMLLRSATSEIARLGDPDDVAALRQILVELGHDPADLAKFDRMWRRSIEKAKTPPAARLRTSVARKLDRAIRGVEGQLDHMDRESRPLLAALVLRLDGESDAAHEAAGHVRLRGVWLTQDAAAQQERVDGLRELEQAARSLPVQIAASTESMLPPTRLLYGDRARHVTSHGVHIHSMFGEPKMERILRHSLRAIALSQAVRGGSLEIPTFDPPLVFVFLSEERDYERALEEAQAENAIHPRVLRQLKQAKALSFIDRRGWRTCSWRPESQYLALVTWVGVKGLLGRGAQPCLVAGHINWLCLRSFGTSTPSVVWKDSAESDKLSTATPSQRDEALWRSASSGVFGCRSWVRQQLASGRNVSFARSIVDQLGKVEAEPLLVATIVAEYLQTRGEFSDLLQDTREMITARKAGSEELSRLQSVEEALGKTLPEFDREWAAWLTADSSPQSGLLQRVRGATNDAAAPAADPHAERALARLRSVRERAFESLDVWVEDVTTFDELSAGARAHARYLEAHPEQKTAWPDAHEEFADRSDFSAEGAWAGGHSLIAFDGDPVKSIDAWMGTFFHRLPLIDPGLCGTGVGVHGETVVLDTGSLRNQYWGDTRVLWPPRAARDVPRHFRPEIPNPVPGEDQSNWGYPITVQAYWGQENEPRTLRLSMVRKGESESVPCHEITPDAPLFERLAPIGAYCLIPKSPLAARASYEVTARCPETGEVTRWAFTTGS